MTAAATLPVPRRRTLFLRLIVATIVGILVFFACVPFTLTSFFVFDAGETPEAWMMFAAAWLVPLVLLLGLIVAWICFAARTTIGVYIGLGLMALPVVTVLVLFALLFAGQI